MFFCSFCVLSSTLLGLVVVFHFSSLNAGIRLQNSGLQKFLKVLAFYKNKTLLSRNDIILPKMKRDLKMMDFKDGKREKKIIKTAFIGIITNFFLAGAKIFIAMVSNSVALISQML